MRPARAARSATRDASASKNASRPDLARDAGHGRGAEPLDRRAVRAERDESRPEVGAARVDGEHRLARRDALDRREPRGDHGEARRPARQARLHLREQVGHEAVEGRREHAVALEEARGLRCGRPWPPLYSLRPRPGKRGSPSLTRGFPVALSWAREPSCPRDPSARATRADVLAPDTALELPRVTVLRASAGSGKTWTLTQRYVQFALSRRCPKNGLAVPPRDHLLQQRHPRDEGAGAGMAEADRPRRRGSDRGDGGDRRGRRPPRADRGACSNDILDGWSDFQDPDDRQLHELGVPRSRHRIRLQPRDGDDHAPRPDRRLRLRAVPARGGRRKRRPRTCSRTPSAACSPTAATRAPSRGTRSRCFAGRSRASKAWSRSWRSRSRPSTWSPRCASREADRRRARVRRRPGARPPVSSRRRRSKLGEALELARAGRFTDLIGTSLRTCPVKKGSARRRTPPRAVRRDRDGVGHGPGARRAVRRAVGALVLGAGHQAARCPAAGARARRAGCAARCTSATSSASCGTGWTRARCPTCTSSSARRSTTG